MKPKRITAQTMTDCSVSLRVFIHRHAFDIFIFLFFSCVCSRLPREHEDRLGYLTSQEAFTSQKTSLRPSQDARGRQSTGNQPVMRARTHTMALWAAEKYADTPYCKVVSTE